MTASELASYIMPGGGGDPRDGLQQARVAEAMGMGALWLGERIDTKDFPSIIGALSQVTDRITLGVGVTPMNLRHPMVLASAGQTLQALCNGRFRMGFGKSADWRWNGYGYPAPTIASMRDVAVILRRLWAGETIEYDGPAGRFPAIRLAARLDMAPPPLYLAAVGPKTLEMAGAHFDGVILHPFLTVDAVRRSSRIIRDSAEKAGRDPEAIRIVACVVAAADLTEEQAKLAAHARGAGYFSVNGLGQALVDINGWSRQDHARYLSQPKFVELGGKPADKFLSREDLIALTDGMPADWIPSSSAIGTATQVRDRLREYLSAGANEILIHGSTAEQLGSLIGVWNP